MTETENLSDELREEWLDVDPERIIPGLMAVGGSWLVLRPTLRNGKHASGPIALQYGPGVQGARGGPIKWRKVQIRPL